MKMKTSELTGAVLDWVVAKCEGKLNLDMGTCRGCEHLEERGISDGSEYRCWLGDLDWCDGGFHSDNPFGEGISVDYGVHQNCPLKTGLATEAFSTNWAQGGPIIEREGISVSLRYHPSTWDAIVKPDYYSSGRPKSGIKKEHILTGETPLIAAMRCFIASKLGDEVEILKELK